MGYQPKHPISGPPPRPTVTVTVMTADDWSGRFGELPFGTKDLALLRAAQSGLGSCRYCGRPLSRVDPRERDCPSCGAPL